MSSIKPIAYLFPQTSRAETPDAPPYDDTREVKSWVDPSPGAGPSVRYQVLDSNANIISLTLSIAEASTLNLPGHPDYPPYAPTPTKSVFAITGNPLTYGVANLSDAQALVTAFELTDAAIFDEMGGYPVGAITYDPSDPRRCYGLHLANGGVVDVAQMLAQQNANGVGAPGKWTQDASGNWSWLPELASSTATTPVMSVPIAPLAQNEQVVMGPFGPEIVVNDPAPAPSGGGTFNAATDPTIQSILTGVNAIRGLLHV